MLIPDRLRALQSQLAAQNLDAYVVPSADPHQSEYVAEMWKRRQFISGFTGSAGLFACTRSDAGLWTDGRYFVQAEHELRSTQVKLMRQGTSDPEWTAWVRQQLPKGGRLGVNPSQFSLSAMDDVRKSFNGSGIEVVPVPTDPVDHVWGQERPRLPDAPLYAHPLQYAGQSHQDKLSQLRLAMAEQDAAAVVVSALDEIAWLFNLRGRDVYCNPVFYAYALVTAATAQLFVDPAKVSAELRAQLGGAVQILPYDGLPASLKTLAPQSRVWLDPQTTSALVETQVRQAGAEPLRRTTPLATWKAAKNKAELAGMRAAHRRDGVAMVKFLTWLPTVVGRDDLDEQTAAAKLETFRREASECLGLSFGTISAYGPNGALPHYSSTPETNRKLQAPGVYLVDSGGQYVDGTTDITRTLALGTPTAQQKQVYTAVLRGHLMLGRALFPRGVDGYQLDALARQPLWEMQLDYNHGTGHGVGAALNVHEGPFSISRRKNMVPLQPGHVVSNEPGCYLEGEFGVRIENLVAVVAKDGSGRFGSFLGFEDLTLCPYDRTLIDAAALSAQERAQVDAYHQRVAAELTPLLGDAERGVLRQLTAPL